MMHGLRLLLMHDSHGSPGDWFWACFNALRAEFDRHHWLMLPHPWMGAPEGFSDSQDALEFPGAGDTELMLWRPGAVGRWADRFAEESIDLMAVPLADDPVALAAEFARVPWRAQDTWMAERAEFFLRYTDSASWDVYARRAEWLDAVRRHHQGGSAISWQTAPQLA